MLKTIIMSIALILSTVILTAEEVQVDTSRGPRTVIVAEDYDTLRQNYLLVSTLYLEERYDHEDSIAHVEQLVELNSQLADEVVPAIVSASNDLITALEERNRIDFLSFIVSAGGGIVGTSPAGAVGVQAILFERLSVSYSVGIPFNMQLLLGWKID